MKLCAVVPAYRVSDHLAGVVTGLQPHVDHVFVVDDCCPDESGRRLQDTLADTAPVTVIRLEKNLGVGGAVTTGYRAAAEAGYDIAVKVDGDGQMDPLNISRLVSPIVAGEADYTKGNRFFDPSFLTAMPKTRLIGNAGLSFISKMSTGQWHVMDPTNGFTAIHTRILPWLQLDRVQKRYFFETDMLYRLGTIDAVVQDIPMPSIYGEEHSNLSARNSLFEFSARHFALLFKRIFYTYFLRSFNMASVFLVTSIPFILFGALFGTLSWAKSIETGQPATAGTIMLAALPSIIGLQLLFGFLSFDMAARPTRALWRRLGKLDPRKWPDSTGGNPTAE